MSSVERDEFVLPPILYWSARLAQRNGDEFAAGVIESAPDRHLLFTWDGMCWEVLDALPADAVRLVCEPREGTSQ